MKERDRYATPWELFDALAEEFRFTVDACAEPQTRKVNRFYGAVAFPEVEGFLGVDGLAQSWTGETVWCNPPYSDPEPWLRKGYESARDDSVLSVHLVPDDHRTGWWRRWVEGRAEVRRVPGYVRFLERDGVTPCAGAYRAPVSVVIFRPEAVRTGAAFWESLRAKLA